MSSSEKAIVHK
uniref:Uncharacterized protein n=1 Tax=Anguilla anguilla TaxID=7936 RepID=A0A0E9VBH8_ANGAN